MQSVKKTKAEVKYSKGNRAEHCGICTFFIASPSRTEDSRCSKVSGTILASDWCELFERK